MDSNAESEQRRARLRQRLVEVLGEEEAETLMAQRPPVDWSQFATKADLEQLRAELTAEMARWGRTHVYTTLVAVVAATSLAFAAAGLG